MKWLVAVALLAACSKEPSEGFPINPGGGGTGSSFVPDAPPPADDGNTTINGKVCLLLSSPHTLATCATTAAGGISVTLGSAMATTSDYGSFTLMKPANTTNLFWRVSALGLEASAIKYGTTTTLPAIDSASYQEMVASTGATIGAGTGALMMRITRQGFAVAGATLAAPSADSGIYYDGPSQTEWQQISTGTFGVAWAPSIATGTPSLTITSGSTDTVVMGQSVFADTITFVLTEIP